MTRRITKKNLSSALTRENAQSWRWRLLVLVFGIVFTAGLASAQSPKIAKDLQEKVDSVSKANGDERVDVIVQFKHTLSEASHEKVRAKGGVLNARLHVVKAGAYSVPANRLKELAEDDDVAYISPNRHLKGHLDVTAATVNAPVAWASGWDGTGIGVAVIDSGIAGADDLNYSNSSATRI